MVFGLFPGILLDIMNGTVSRSLADVSSGTAIAIDPVFVAAALGALVAIIVVRIATLPSLRRSAAAPRPAESAS